MKTITNNSELDDFITFAKTSKFAERLGGKNCVRYERVSSKEQELGFSLDTQQKENIDAIARENFNCLGVFGGKYESAKTDERDEFNRMLKFVRSSKERISFIVVSDVTRFSRSGANAIYIASQLRKENIKIYSVNNPADTDTATGKMQQNMQFIFAEYDNDLKREKIISNGISMLMEGWWCTKAPIGYNQITRHKRYNTDLPVRQIISVNETGLLIKKAFHWKADKMSNVEILKKLDALGLKLCKKRLDKILKNPFYCGILSHNWLNGKLIEGNHEKLITKEIFLKANDMKARNATWKHNNDFLEVPLKNFLKCGTCGSSFCGYLVKAKNLWYYKCNKTGCKCNRSAKALNDQFIEELSAFTIAVRYLEPIKDEFTKYCLKTIEDNGDNVELLKVRLNEAEQKISTINERFALGEINKDLHTEFSGKFIKERMEVKQKIGEFDFKNSNLVKRIEKYMQLLLNPAQLWASNGYKGKLELQEIMFPQGIYYEREKGRFRTNEINEVLNVITSLSDKILGKKKGDFGLYNQKSPSVPGTGLEPVHP
ncbi:MAG: recombinase family protein [Bacteroidia bacterium]